jgi:hypothetical protein
VLSFKDWEVLPTNFNVRLFPQFSLKNRSGFLKSKEMSAVN